MGTLGIGGTAPSSLFGTNNASSLGVGVAAAAPTGVGQYSKSGQANLFSTDPNVRVVVGGQNAATAPQATGGATTSSLNTYDPYAAYGGRTAYNNLVNGFNAQKSTIYDTSNQAAANTGISLGNSILDLIDSYRSGQQSIDNRAVNNELAKQRGTADVYGSINRGVRSGGVTLANRNASDSSAAEAIARAYGDIGRRQLSDIGNQYELENQDIGLAQQDLGAQVAAGQRKIQGSKEQAVNSIVSEAQNQLAALDAAMANASLPQRIQIDAEKNNIRNQVLARLAQYDAQLSQGVSSVHGMDQNQRVSEATRRAQLGMAPENAFNYSTDTPVSLQNTGPFASELPIFTYRNRNDQ